MSVVVSGAAVTDTEPAADEWGVVVRLAGPGGQPYIQKRFDIQTTVIYIGYALRGAVNADASWTIKRIQLSGGNPTTSQWSDPDQVWNDRATVTYS